MKPFKKTKAICVYKVDTDFKCLRMIQNLHDTLAIYQYMLAKYKNNELLTKIVKSYNLG